LNRDWYQVMASAVPKKAPGKTGFSRRATMSKQQRLKPIRGVPFGGIPEAVP
jgi:hypothetical protein